MVGRVGEQVQRRPPRLGCGQKGQREAKPTSMQTGPLGPRWNRITENAENCDVCFNLSSRQPEPKEKVENWKQLSLPHVVVVGSAFCREARDDWTPATCHQDRQLFWPLQRGGGCHCVNQGHLVCGRAGHRPLAGHPLVGSGLMCLEAPPPGGLWGVRDTSAQKRVRSSCQARWHLTVCPYPKQCISSKPASSLPFASSRFPAHQRSVLILNLTFLLSF